MPYERPWSCIDHFDWTLEVTATIGPERGHREYALVCNDCGLGRMAVNPQDIREHGGDPLSLRVRRVIPVDRKIGWCSGAEFTSVGVSGHSWDLDVLVKVNGVRDVSIRCTKCHLGFGVRHAVLRDAGIEPRSLPARRSYVGDGGACIVDGCESLEVEWHHFAPRNVFGDECDRWPVMPLCREHHGTWHLAMNGYRWGNRAVAVKP